MTKQEKINYAQTCVSASWSCSSDSFTKNENIFIETDQTFFEIITFGYNAVIRADKKIFSWCIKKFTNTLFNEIMDGENLYILERKMRKHGKKLGGEHLRFLQLDTEMDIPKPQGFTFEIYEQERISDLYQDKRFENAFNYEAKNERLAIVAKKDKDIAAVVATDDYHKGFCEIGIDTIDVYRGKGLAAYLVNEMARECENRKAVPFYTTWSANIASMRTAMSAGFQPVWLVYFAESL